MSDTQQVHEIAIRKVKPGKDNAFRQRRADFIQTLTKQQGVGTDREFASFLSSARARRHRSVHRNDDLLAYADTVDTPRGQQSDRGLLTLSPETA